MEILAWVWWASSNLVSILWSLIWFLISGWVSTFLQILIVVGIIYVAKFGWRRAPFQMIRHAQTSGRMFWNWLRAKEGLASTSSENVRDVVRVVHLKDVGDINISTLMTLTMLAGLVWISLI